jgi:hypothetical protein
LLLAPKAGADESAQEVAFEDEELRTTDPPVDGTLLELRESEAVGLAAGEGVEEGLLAAAAWATFTLRCT